jgi:hypothetical protein
MIRNASYLAALMAVGVAVPALAAPPRLPIAEGVWVKTDTACGTAFIAHVYSGKKFGTVYFYGPNQTLGPADESEVLSRTSAGTDGFTKVNEGPLEVLPRPGGQALVRAFSPSQGEVWREPVRLCPTSALSAKMRAGLGRLGLIASPGR